MGYKHVYISSLSPGQGEGLSVNWDIYQKLSEVYILCSGTQEINIQIESVHSFTKYLSNTSFVPVLVPGADTIVVIRIEAYGLLERAAK